MDLKTALTIKLQIVVQVYKVYIFQTVKQLKLLVCINPTRGS